MRSLLTAGAMAITLAMGLAARPQAAPGVGDKAPEFSLMSLQGKEVRLADELRRGSVVLVLFRGWPGYQCPFCTRQFADYLAHAGDLQKAGARVLFVYPGPVEGLKEHADAFVRGRDLPAGFTFLVDPDYAFTAAYGLRWDAPGETAYPATFILDPAGTIRFAQISRGHGNRVPVTEVLEALSGR